MKKFFEILAFSFISVLFFACSDSSSGFSAGDVCPESGRGTFIDDRDGQVYKYTTIGDQIWMAENLKYNAEYSVCYDSLNGFCDTYGRFYSLQK
ncbi:MAG: FISUMP domain-containing protein, partial [Hallerella porci]